MVIKNNIHYNGIFPFDFTINYVELDSVSHLNINELHTHEECEIYINVSGDVSFMVEDNVYPIKPGSIIVTRPNEFHHCIYRSNALHKHFWILVSTGGNEKLFDFFFERGHGTKNLITPSPEDSRRIYMICKELLNVNLSEIEKYKLFFDLLAIIRAGVASEVVFESDALPQDVGVVSEFINANFTASISVSELAALAHVSVNTLERHFKAAFSVTPTEYILKKRLSYAQELLKHGYSVQEACEGCGFSDYSYFISVFKKTFNLTPLKYKKLNSK